MVNLVFDIICWGKYMKLDDSITSLAGIGPKKAQYLDRLGIHTLYDFITHFPRGYEDNRLVTPIADLEAGEIYTVLGKILYVNERKANRRGMTILNAGISDGTGILGITWFNNKYLKAKLKIGRKLFVTGKAAYAYGGQGSFEMSQLRSFQLLEDNDDGEGACRIVPIYPATAGLNQKFFSDTVKKILSDSEGLEELLPDWIISRNSLMGRRDAYWHMHFPETMELLAEAKKRLAFEELYFIQCGLMLLKKRTVEANKGICHKVNGALVHKIEQSLPFKLTGDQMKAWHEISNDMERVTPMRRLLQGDVGSGKTVVALLALIKTVENGFQGALMAPTEILAHQHYDAFTEMLDGTGIRVGFLTGSLSKKKRGAVYESISRHELDIVIGTHALIQDGVSFASLGLVITDEQHRFGISQRAMLEKLGDAAPDVLVMTATPIPRTMTLTIYGDLDVSLIREMPPGRKPVRTFLRGQEARANVYKYMRQQLEKGRQGYVVCPMIEMNEESDAISAEEVYEELSTGIFAGMSCGLVHGKLSAAEKESVMDAFHAGEIKLLVATTVIEVGVNVPNAIMMVVEHAERFGMAQLHQLRGRVGRGVYKNTEPYCVLISGGRYGKNSERLKIMESTTDGFILAEEDLRLRGPGQFFGSMQHGLPDLKVANVLEDIDILLKARDAAIDTINNPSALAGVLPVLEYKLRNHFEKITES